MIESKEKNRQIVLLADDDADDRLLIREAFEENQIEDCLVCVEDGEELMDFLYHRGKYSLETDLPNLILLDLNMPRKSGFEALREIRSDSRYRRIPIVILTTSKADRDIFESYDLGVNSFIVKPSAFDDLVETVRFLKNYWFKTVELPSQCDARVSELVS